MAGPEKDVLDRMREDWNRRAHEDAKYYVAFGRREQDDEEFFDTAAGVVRDLTKEMMRMPGGTPPRARRALEIGCGPGRIMLPLSRHFGEIHGVDVSDEMIRMARERLRDIPHAHAHVTRGADLAAFAGESFDLVYSYAVFQHIPSREVIFSYLREVRRVLKPGGILRCQFNGLAEEAARYDTWSGVRLTAREIADFAREHDFQLLTLEGALTQYMWTTWRKRAGGWCAALSTARPKAAVIRRITNACAAQHLVPARGRFAFAALWVEGLPEDFDLNHGEVLIDQSPVQPTYIGHPEGDGLQQVNVPLPAGVRTGLVPVRIFWLGRPVSGPASVRVIPPGPEVPRVVSVADGINILSGNRIVSGSVKVMVEEARPPLEFEATVGGQPVEEVDVFCTDPALPRFEINFKLPASLAPGWHHLEMRLGRRQFPPAAIEVVGKP